ncbi:hypothetical protein TWF191_003485 [Orbilia oligospora]|uniref:Cardiolipin synthase N-terminal domain-containing protein n=4 Tax=Orbiliaceae TaxID=47021 RepID=A0A7C8Q7S7_ORBOL|nr:hypothetical protein TWF191_003485 [Orbilia oligospora]
MLVDVCRSGEAGPRPWYSETHRIGDNGNGRLQRNTKQHFWVKSHDLSYVTALFSHGHGKKKQKRGTMLFFILTALLSSLALAAPVSDEIITIQENAWGYGAGGGIVGLIIFILDVLVFIELFKSSRPASHKILWGLFVFFFPILGLIIYYLFSNRQNYTHNYEALP